jgi:fibronectin-binding autotransporter adhesin
VSGNVGAQLIVRESSSIWATSGNIGTPSAGLLMEGGSVNYSGALTMTPGGNNNSIIHISSGTLTASSLSLGRTATFTTTEPIEGFTTVGLLIDGGTVNVISNLSLGDNALANSTVNARMDAGRLTVGGALIVGLNNTGRWSIMDVNGGTLTVNDATTGISVGSSQAGNAILLVQDGGVATTPRISLGQGANIGTSVISLSSGGTLYLGSGGIVQVSTNIATAIRLSDGTLGAADDWSSAVSMTVSGVTIQAADSGSTPHNITLSGALSGSTFTKTGAGVLTLSSTNNSYADGATVNAGTLLVNGSVASGVNVNSGGTLGGSGTINGSVSIADGATLSPGASPGTLTINGNLGLNDTSILAYELGASSDLTVVNGDLTLDGVVNVTNSGGLGNGNYTLIAYTGSLSDNTLNVGTLPSPFSGSISNDLVNKRVVLVVSGGAPPDPFATWQNQYFGCTNCPQALPGADPDGDGMSNTNEFLAGFNPTNSAAFLHVISIAKSGNDINVTYLGANGDSSGSPGPKTNVLEFSTGTGAGSYTNNFVSAGVTNILTGGSGVGQITNMIDSGGATAVPSRFYRVRVLVP